MPLMQLKTEVLPAPFGPINANSSPGSTANETLSRTTRPPKRSVSAEISISAIPSPAAAILLDAAIAAPVAAGRLSEIEFLNVAMRAQPCGVAVEHHAAVLQHIAVVGDFQRNRRALFDNDNGDAKLAANL